MLQGGTKQTDVARRLGVHRTTIARLWSRFNTTGSTNDSIRPGQRRTTTPGSLYSTFTFTSTLSRCHRNKTNSPLASQSKCANNLKSTTCRGTTSTTPIQRTNIDSQSKIETLKLSTHSFTLAPKSVDQRVVQRRIATHVEGS